MELEYLYGIVGVLIIATGIVNLSGSDIMLKTEYRGSPLAREWQRNNGFLYLLIGACSVACGLIDLNSQAGILLTVIVVVLMLVWLYLNFKFRREWREQQLTKKKKKKH